MSDPRMGQPLPPNRRREPPANPKRVRRGVKLTQTDEALSSSWAAQRWHGFPAQGEQAFDLAQTLQLPILALQDPGDPVTPAGPMQALAGLNPNITLWLAPDVDPSDPRLADMGRWGTHVAAFHLFPEQTIAEIAGFISRTREAPRS